MRSRRSAQRQRTTPAVLGSGLSLSRAASSEQAAVIQTSTRFLVEHFGPVFGRFSSKSLNGSPAAARLGSSLQRRRRGGARGPAPAWASAAFGETPIERGGPASCGGIAARDRLH